MHGLLSSDLIGFHIWEYARNFINSCQRLLGLDYELGAGNTLSVMFNKRHVHVRIQHIGLDTEFIENLMQGEEFEKACSKVMNTVKNAAIIQQRNNIRASLSRGNLNTVQNNMRSALSTPMLIGAAGLSNQRRQYINATSIISTQASSNAAAI